MRFCVLGSGSKGNCTFVASKSVGLLIDAGFSGIEIQRRLAGIGVDINSIQAILITHEHGDHIKGVGVLSRKLKIPVFINAGTRMAAGKSLDNLYEVREFTTGTSFKFSHFDIHPFAISHDTADPVGFTIADDRASFGYCTDTGMVSKLIHHHLSHCHALVLECNHDLEMLRNGHYPPALQQRIRSKNGHLANPDTINCLKDLINPSLRHVVLAHISESNNCPELVQKQIDTFLAGLQCGTTLEPDTLPLITIAHQDHAGELICLY